MMVFVLFFVTVGVFMAFVLIHSSNIAKHTVGYRIKKGKHYSVRESDLLKIPFKPGIVRGNRLEFDFMFNGGCIYDNKIIGDEVNKLYGMTFGFDVHYRSLRLGWRYVGNGYIQLMVYTYSDGERAIKYLYTVKPYNTYKCIMVKGSDKESGVSLFDGNGNLLAMATVNINSVSDWFKFRCYPYFGGAPVAPNDMVIYVTEK